MSVQVITPLLVRRTIRAGQIYRSGPRRWVRVLRVCCDPPSVTVCGVTRHGGKVRGARSQPWISYLTWRDGAWCMPLGYEVVS